MNFVKDLLVDAMNGFSPRFIPFFIMQILSAALLAHLFQRMYNRKLKATILERSALIATVVTILVALAKNSLIIAVLAAAAILLFTKLKDTGKSEILGLIVVNVIAIGCGSGSIVQTAIGCLVLFCVILFTPLKE
jgi:branched-subunit amino acid transport protein